MERTTETILKLFFFVLFVFLFKNAHANKNRAKLRNDERNDRCVATANETGTNFATHTHTHTQKHRRERKIRPQKRNRPVVSELNARQRGEPKSFKKINKFELNARERGEPKRFRKKKKERTHKKKPYETKWNFAPRKHTTREKKTWILCLMNTQNKRPADKTQKNVKRAYGKAKRRNFASHTRFRKKWRGKLKMDLREASIKIKARGRFIVIRTGASHDRPCTMRRPRAPEFIGPLTLISGLARTAIAGDGRSTSLSLSLSFVRPTGHEDTIADVGRIRFRLVFFYSFSFGSSRSLSAGWWTPRCCWVCSIGSNFML